MCGVEGAERGSAWSAAYGVCVRSVNETANCACSLLVKLKMHYNNSNGSAEYK